MGNGTDIGAIIPNVCGECNCSIAVMTLFAFVGFLTPAAVQGSWRKTEWLLPAVSTGKDSFEDRDDPARGDAANTNCIAGRNLQEPKIATRGD
jgi:hypothetical protein